jgi:TatD DNase family protein
MIDIGINILNRQFQHDTDEVIDRAFDAGVEKMILTGVNVANSIKSVEFCKKYNHDIYCTVGIHPHEAKSMTNESMNTLRKLSIDKNVKAIGECGLDYDRDFSPRPIQKKCFEAQIELAIELNLPLFLHERAAFQDFNLILDAFKDKLTPAVVHCFTGSIDEAKIYLDRGYYLGFTGAVTDERRFSHLREVLNYVPLNRMMLETDSPFMLPKNMNSGSLRNNERRNEPAFLPFVSKFIAQVKNISTEKLNEETSLVAKKFFKI